VRAASAVKRCGMIDEHVPSARRVGTTIAGAVKPRNRPFDPKPRKGRHTVRCPAVSPLAGLNAGWAFGSGALQPRQRLYQPYRAYSHTEAVGIYPIY